MQDETKKETVDAGTPPTQVGAAVAEQQRNPNMKWYIIHSYSGFERKVKESLESRVRAFGLFPVMRPVTGHFVQDRLGAGLGRGLHFGQDFRLVIIVL